MKIVLGIFGQPAKAALPFAEAALHAGHVITQVFFYGDGVLCISTAWQQISTSLLVCSSSALKRGFTEVNITTGFQISGLGQFMQAMKDADRYMIFGR